MANLVRLIGYLRYHKVSLALAIVSVFGSVAFTSATPWILKEAVDKGIGDHNVRALVLSAAAILAFSVGKGFFAYLQAYFGESLSQHVAFDLRREFASRLRESPGVSDHHVRDWLGHADLATTSRYLATTRVGLRHARAAFERHWAALSDEKPQPSENVSSSVDDSHDAIEGRSQVPNHGRS